MTARIRDWWEPRSPDEVEKTPRLHRDAIIYFDEILRPEFSVLEHGSGGSTLWLAERVAHVVTIEHSLEWSLKIRELAPTNVTILATIPDPGSFYDVFFIDGERAKRGPCLLAARGLVKPGGWVVLDNSNRPEYAAERAEFAKCAHLVKRYDRNVEISKYFVTEFWRCQE
jgi:hypothetical protein